MHITSYRKCVFLHITNKRSLPSSSYVLADDWNGGKRRRREEEEARDVEEELARVAAEVREEARARHPQPYITPPLEEATTHPEVSTHTHTETLFKFYIP